MGRKKGHGRRAVGRFMKGSCGSKTRSPDWVGRRQVVSYVPKGRPKTVLGASSLGGGIGLSEVIAPSGAATASSLWRFRSVDGAPRSTPPPPAGKRGSRDATPSEEAAMENKLKSLEG